MSDSDPFSLGKSRPLVPPLYQSSVYTLPDLDTLDLIMEGEEAGFIYARDGHPNAQLLAQQIAALEHADWAVICGSGMAAISATIVSLLEQGDRLIASHRLYGKTTQLLRDELPRYGIETEFVDTCDLDQVEQAFEKPAGMLLVETLSNPLLRLSDLPKLARLAHENDCTFVVDNTFATPQLIKPMDIGGDLVIESLTKMMGGHSDVTLGVVCGSDRDLAMQIPALVSIWGFAANPFDCWLTERGLSTLPLRMKQACDNALAAAQWLTGQSEISRVIYPGLEDHPDHELAKELMDDRFGNMLCFEVKGGRAAVNRFLRQAPEIPFSPSLGNVTTTLSHPALTSHRYVSPAEKRRQGITDGLIRLSVGVEEYALLEAALEKGLS